MEAKKKYEELLQSVHDLPEEQQAKVVSLIERLQEEEKRKRIEGYRKAIEELQGKYKHSLSSVDEFMERKADEKNWIYRHGERICVRCLCTHRLFS